MKTEVKERPILFSTEMVRAIRDDKKTQTRRICKHQYWSFSELLDVNENEITQKVDRNVSCPYGRVGDRLWVRETFCALYMDESKKEEEPNPIVVYKSDEIWDDGEYTWKWKPSIHMPKIFAKHFLEITSIRVDRLHDISEEDAIKEGVKSRSFNNPENTFYQDYSGDGHGWLSDPIKSFKSLWDSINGQDSWDANPFVWVITFERIY